MFHDWYMAQPSFMSVFVRALYPHDGDPEQMKEVIQGTGFVLWHNDQHFLITNGHVVTGRDRLDDTPLRWAARPTHLEVALPMSGRPAGLAENDLELIGSSSRLLELFDEDGRALWFVHPLLGRRADVVALPLSEHGRPVGPGERISLMPYSLGPADPALSLGPTDDVSIIGFPFGRTGGARSALWVRGTVASEPDLNYNGEPCFLVDARSREGQSGSPVISYSPGPKDDCGKEVHASWSLVGVYSGRLSDESDLGRVWRRSVLKTVVESQQRDTVRSADA